MRQMSVLKKGKRDRELESVQTLSERHHSHVYLEQKAELAVRRERAAQRRLSETEADMEIRNWEEQKSFDMALCETNRELQPQRLELYHANQWADQAQREKISLIWRNGWEKQNLSRKSRTNLPRN